jgi:ribosome recycling factor
MVDEYLNEMKEDFQKAMIHFGNSLKTIRTGRASPQLLDMVMVHVASYGASMPVKQLATITAPDARLLVVNPWDKGTLGDIEKSIRAANLGLNPGNDGQIIRVPIPPLTGERRRDLLRKVKQMTEDARVRARKIRREYNDIFKELEGEKEISEDESRRLLDQVQEATNVCIRDMDNVGQEKENEVMDI